MDKAEQEIKDLIDLLKKEYHNPRLHCLNPNDADMTTDKIKSLFLYIVNFAYERNLSVEYFDNDGLYKTIVFRAEKYTITISEFINGVRILYYLGDINGKHSFNTFSINIPYRTFLFIDELMQELPEDQLAWLYLQGVNLK